MGIEWIMYLTLLKASANDRPSAKAMSYCQDREEDASILVAIRDRKPQSFLISGE